MTDGTAYAWILSFCTSVAGVPPVALTACVRGMWQVKEVYKVGVQGKPYGMGGGLLCSYESQGHVGYGIQLWEQGWGGDSSLTRTRNSDSPSSAATVSADALPAPAVTFKATAAGDCFGSSWHGNTTRVYLYLFLLGTQGQKVGPQSFREVVLNICLVGGMGSSQ